MSHTVRMLRSLRPRLPLALLLLPLLPACATVPAAAPQSDPDLSWVLSGAGLPPPADAAPLEDPATLMRVSPEMHRFAVDATIGKFGTSRKVEALVDGLAEGRGHGLHLAYDASATLTAQQAFEQRRANCLSYTLLFVALARDVGIPVDFNDVQIPPIWDLGDNRTSLLYRHLNVRVEMAPPLYQVVDVSGDEYDPSFTQHQISDEEAEAQYYNNRAMELLLQQRRPESLRYELRALQLAPKAPYLWINLAVVYLRDDRVRAARIAVDRGLALDRSSQLGYETAAQVYTALHQDELARRYQQLAQEFLDRNPYYHYQLALAALDRHDERLAYDETRRAIELRQEEPRFFFLLALLDDRRGEPAEAYDSMRTVLQLTRDPSQQERYRSKFARLKEQQG
ncbi:MAG: hypothetical protein JOY51_02720 [Nevskia sp.]|nr:hypothetical protein [Nevskia sp.]